jgi:hypothetical protein
MSLSQKIRHGWGYDVGPSPPQVVLSSGQIAYWPDDTPPTIAEIEAVDLTPILLAEAKSAKHAELDAAWATHPGVQVTLADESEFYAPIQREALTLNRLEVLQATLESRNANVFDYSGLPVTIPAAELTAVATAVTVGVQSVLTAYYTIQATIAAATTEEAVQAIEVAL